MLLIGVAALLFFGPDQLPKVARRAGQVVRDVQSTSASFIREMERAADEPSPRSHYVSEPFRPDPDAATYEPPRGSAYEPAETRNYAAIAQEAPQTFPHEPPLASPHGAPSAAPSFPHERPLAPPHDGTSATQEKSVPELPEPPDRSTPETPRAF
jgi:Sec-independent protein translocase protein TatA